MGGALFGLQFRFTVQHCGTSECEERLSRNDGRMQFIGSVSSLLTGS